MGGGALPQHLAETCQKNKWPYFVLAVKGQVSPQAIVGHPHQWISIGRLKSALDRLHVERVTDIVMAGYIHRAALWTWQWDSTTLRFLVGLGGKIFQEDGLLREVIRFVEADGFHVRSVTDVAADLKMPVGVVGTMAPEGMYVQLIERGMALAKAQGSQDVGQAVIVSEDGLIMREGRGGTDALIERYNTLRNPKKRGILVKACKPQQDRRIDLPAIGVETIRQAHASGLAGVVMDADYGIILDRKHVIQQANTLGLFLYGHTQKNT